MSLDMTQVLTLLQEHQLFTAVTGDQSREFTSVTYDSRQAQPDTLFFL